MAHTTTPTILPADRQQRLLKEAFICRWRHVVRQCFLAFIILLSFIYAREGLTVYIYIYCVLIRYRTINRKKKKKTLIVLDVEHMLEIALQLSSIFRLECK